MLPPSLAPAYLEHNEAFFVENPFHVSVPAPSASIPSDFDGLLEYVGQVYVRPVEEALGAGFTVPDVFLHGQAIAGRIVYRLSDVLPLLPAFEGLLPAADVATPRRVDGGSKRVWLKTVVRAGQQPVGETAYQSWVVVRGGLPRRSAVFGTFFTEYSDGYLPFLTAQPNPAPVVPGQPLFLYRLQNFEPGSSPALRVVRHRANGTTATSQPVALVPDYRNGLYVWPVGMEALGIEADVVAYHVCLVNQTGERLSEWRTYLPERQSYTPPPVLLFDNGLGGYDSLAFFGDDSQKTTFSGETARLAEPTTPTRTSRLGRDFRPEGQREITLRTGYLPSPEWVNYLQSVCYSADVRLFDPETRAYLPLRRGTTELNLHTEANRVLSAELTFYPDANESAYFPI